MTCSECGAEIAHAAQEVHDLTRDKPLLLWRICAACARPGESMILRARAWQERQQTKDDKHVE